MYPLNLAILVANKTLESELDSTLSKLAIRKVFTDPAWEQSDDLAGRLERSSPDVVIIGPGNRQSAVLECIRAVKALQGSPAIVVLNSSKDPDTILEMVRAGVNEYLYPPFDEKLEKALRSISEQRERAVPASSRDSKIIGMLSAKGGCGATTIACHVAREIGSCTNTKVLLADLDLQAGGVRFATKAQSDYSILDATSNLYRLDVNFWKALISNGIRGVEVISAPHGDVLSVAEPTSDQVRQVLQFVRTQYPFTVVDLGRGRSDVTVGALDEIDNLVLVTTLDITAMHQAKALIRGVVTRGFPQSSIRLVLNQMPKNPELTVQEITKNLGVEPFASIPSDYSALYEKQLEGGLLSSGTTLGTAYSRLAHKLAGVPVPKTKRRGFSLFGS